MTDRPLMLDYTARMLFWLMIIVSIWILLRGHNAPGGGFIAGLVAVTATALLTIVYGRESAGRMLPLSPLVLTCAGVLLTLSSGIPALVTGDPYLTHVWWTLDLGITSIKLSTVLLFDAGVYAAVWGAFCLYLLALLGDDK